VIFTGKCCDCGRGCAGAAAAVLTVLMDAVSLDAGFTGAAGFILANGFCFDAATMGFALTGVEIFTGAVFFLGLIFSTAALTLAARLFFGFEFLTGTGFFTFFLGSFDFFRESIPTSKTIEKFS
jgi:hypothetical protein